MTTTTSMRALLSAAESPDDLGAGLLSGHFAGLLTGLVVGTVAGAVFFGALWRTVRALPASDHLAGLLLVSYVLRLAFALGAFFVLARTSSSPGPLLAAVCGFTLVRIAAVRRAKPDGGPRTATGGAT